MTLTGRRSVSVGLSLIMADYFLKRISTAGSLKAKTPNENTAILFLQAVPRQERGRRGRPIELGCLPAPIRGLVVIFRPLFLACPFPPLNPRTITSIRARVAIGKWVTECHRVRSPSVPRLSSLPRSLVRPFAL